MMEMKKRPLADDQEMGIAKKRAVASITDSPVPLNGKADSAEDLNAENLESFRKAAIFRRMKHYSRENERAHDKIAELEKCRQMLEANVAAIAACWEQLLQEVKLLVKPETLTTPDAFLNDAPNVFELIGNPENRENSVHLSETLREHGHATQKLIAAFVHLGPKAVSPDNDDLRKQCSRLHREVAILSAELQTANARILKVEGDKDQLHLNLLAAEARADRAQSVPVRVMRAPSVPAASSLPGAPAGGDQEEDKHATNDEASFQTKPEELDTKVPMLPSPPATNEQQMADVHEPAPHVEDNHDWRAIYELSDKKNQEMAEELLQLKGRCSELASELASPSMETLQKAPLYEALIQRLQYFKTDAETYKQKCSDLNKQAHELNELQEDFKEKLNADYSVRYDEQKTMMVKRDHETVRLREQRDTLQAEVAELKSRMAEKKSTGQLQILLQSRADRIAAYELENKRLKSQLAANAGEKDVLDLILGDSMSNLPEKLAETERKLEALQASLSNLNNSEPDITQHIRSETEAREALAVTMRSLERFESIFASDSTLPPDQSTVVRQLQEKQEQLRIANLQLQQQRVASNDLFSEIERLSAAWEVLDRQSKTKGFDLDAMEAKLQKISGEKAKADNKYFAAMRQKEAAETERKATLRTVEKLQKAVERFSEAEKGFSSKLTGQEKELSLFKTRCDVNEELATNLERRLEEQQLRYEDVHKQSSEIKRQLIEANRRAEQYRSDARRFEEDNIKVRREAERQSVKATAVTSGKATAREMELEQKYEKCMKILRCSTCKANLRSHVLTKCMHSFCKECVQARIDTRQRKCPACNMGFSQGEFQQLYFQG